MLFHKAHPFKAFFQHNTLTCKSQWTRMTNFTVNKTFRTIKLSESSYYWLPTDMATFLSALNLFSLHHCITWQCSDPSLLLSIKRLVFIHQQNFFCVLSGDRSSLCRSYYTITLRRFPFIFCNNWNELKSNLLHNYNRQPFELCFVSSIGLHIQRNKRGQTPSSVVRTQIQTRNFATSSCG